jgi:hypothetical protein
MQQAQQELQHAAAHEAGVRLINAEADFIVAFHDRPDNKKPRRYGPGLVRRCYVKSGA